MGIAIHIAIIAHPEPRELVRASFHVILASTGECDLHGDPLLGCDGILVYIVPSVFIHSSVLELIAATNTREPDLLLAAFGNNGAVHRDIFSGRVVRVPERDKLCTIARFLGMHSAQ